MAENVFEGISMKQNKRAGRAYSQYRAVIEVGIASLQCRLDVVKPEVTIQI